MKQIVKLTKLYFATWIEILLSNEISCAKVKSEVVLKKKASNARHKMETSSKIKFRKLDCDGEIVLILKACKMKTRKTI